MSMIPFLDHAETCKVCHARPDLLCAIGKQLFEEGRVRLMRKLDPAKRAKA
jgi:hypothetical protein